MRRLVQIATAIAMLLLLPAPVAAGWYCYMEGLAGGSAGANRLDSGGGSVTIATDGYTAGIGSGCDLVIATRWVVGALARAQLAHIDSSSSSFSLSTDASFTGAVRAGVFINPGTIIYGLAGLTMQRLEVDRLTTLDGKGLLVGVGIETAFADGWRIGAEVNRVDLGRFTDPSSGDNLRPASTSALITVKRLFWLGE